MKRDDASAWLFLLLYRIHQRGLVSMVPHFEAKGERTLEGWTEVILDDRNKNREGSLMNKSAANKDKTFIEKIILRGHEFLASHATTRHRVGAHGWGDGYCVPAHCAYL